MHGKTNESTRQMELIDTPGNPAPPGAMPAMIACSDGLAIRSVRWQPHEVAPGTVVIGQGRGEFTEKYFEVIGELLARNFHVVAFDWRGQGLSARELPNARKGHIDDFSLYERDLAALAAQVLAPHCPKPWFGLGHSMGAAIFLMHAASGHCLFERLVLSAPMLGLAGLQFPRAVRWLAAALDMAGFGASFIPGGGNTAYLTKPFAGNVLTSDPQRYARFGALATAAPQLAVGSPTVGWLHAAFRLMEQFPREDFSLSMRVPCLMVAAGNDQVVDSRAAEKLGAQIKLARTITIPQSMHEILVERDVFRQQFWAAFDAFVPGS